MIQALIIRLLGRQVIENYGALVEEAAKHREVKKALMDALAFYADEESYEGDPVPVMEDRGMSARVILKVAKETLGESRVLSDFAPNWLFGVGCETVTPSRGE